MFIRLAKLCYKEITSTLKRNKILSYNNSLTPEEVDDSYRMYVVVRRDVLPLVHAGVQAAHAAADFVFYHPNENTKVWAQCEKTMIILETSEAQIEYLMQLFKQHNLNYQPFWEPDMSGILTAVAFQPIKTKDAKVFFSNLKLLN